MNSDFRHQLADELAAYFRSGNDVPVERATIPADLAQRVIEALKPWNERPVSNCRNCHTCLHGEFISRMILCPTCGNKRCPKASDHRLECTNSNEPGQKGSIWEFYKAP